MAFSPTAPPTAPFNTLAPPSANVPVFAPAVVVRAPISVVFGARLMVPSAAKLVAVMFVDPLLKFTAPVPLTFSVVAKTGPWKLTVVPLLPPERLRRNGPPGWVTPMFPNTVELLLNTILPWLEAAVDTAGGTVARAVLLVKISISGPPGTPTLRVPVVPETDK